MRLQLVTFEQAKALKSLRFDWNVSYVYEYDGELVGRNTPFGGANFNNSATSCSAPATALALKWIRDFHQIHAYMLYSADGRWWHSNGKYTPTSGYEKYDTYEDAETALLDATIAELMKIKETI